MRLHKLPDISVRQLYRYLGRYVRHSVAATRAVAPSNRIRVPREPGVGVFFFPADSWKKRTAFAVGPLGETSATLHPAKFQIARPVNNPADVSPSRSGIEAGAGERGPSEGPETHVLHWGTGGSVSVTKNALSGVTEGFAVTLELHGVGFRVESDDARNVAVLRLGFSHTVELPLTQGDTFLHLLTPQLLQVAGINREHVHQLAAKIRALRPPEPYKGKGIRYKNEPIRRKETRKA